MHQRQIAPQPQRVPYPIAFELLQRRSVAGEQVARQVAVIDRLAAIAQGDAELERFLASIRGLQAACDVTP